MELQRLIYFDSFDKTTLKRMEAWCPWVDLVESGRYQDEVRDAVPASECQEARDSINYLNRRARMWAASWLPNILVDEAVSSLEQRAKGS